MFEWGVDVLLEEGARAYSVRTDSQLHRDTFLRVPKKVKEGCFKKNLLEFVVVWSKDYEQACHQ